MEKKLIDFATSMGYNTLYRAALYILVHEAAFEKEFVNYCKYYLKEYYEIYD